MRGVPASYTAEFAGSLLFVALLPSCFLFFFQLIRVSDYVRMEVTLVGSSWDVVAGDQTGVDFIPMKFCGVPSRLALEVGAPFQNL